MSRLLLLLSIPALSLGCSGSGDDGRWIVQELTTDAEFMDVYFLDAHLGWVVGGGYPVEGGIVGSTVDGGRTWSFKSDLIHRETRPHTIHLQSVWFLDERRGFIAADEGKILRTVDGGAHWHTVHRGGRHLSDLYFVDEWYGWAVGGATLIRTTDGGETWERPIPPDADLPFSARAIRFLDRDLGWAVGTAGAIYHTADGGESWTQQAKPQSGLPDLRALAFLDTDRGWAVGEIGTILRTTDGGLTWTPHLKVEGEALFSMKFTETGHGWAVGERVRPHAQKLLRYEPAATD